MMPSIRLFEGDLSYIMNRLEHIEGRLDHRLSDISSAMAAIIGDIRVINKGLHSVNNRQDWPALAASDTARPPLTGNHTMQASHCNAIYKQVADGNPTTDSLKTNMSESSRKNCDTASNDSLSSIQMPIVGNWAVASTPITKQLKQHRMKPVQSTTSTESDANQESTDDHFFTRVHSKKKRRREKSQQEAVTKLYSAAEVGVSQSQKRGPLIVGKATPISSSMPGGVKAAKRTTEVFINKKIFCIDNVDSSCSVEDIVNFVSAMSVQVLSCFPAKSRRRRTDVDGELPDRNAFRLCINSAHCERLLNEHQWPAYVCISEWFFKSSVEQSDVTTPIYSARQPIAPNDSKKNENVEVVDMEETILTQDSLEKTLTREDGGS